MYKRTVAIAAAAMALTVPMVLPAGAQITLPDHGSMPASAKSSSNGAMGSMSATDMLKRQINAAKRAEAVANAKALGKPSQTRGHHAMIPGGTPDYFGSSPNYATSPLPRITWKSAGSINGVAHNAGDPVALPSYDASANVLYDPTDPNGVVTVTPAESPYAVDPVTSDVVTDAINQVPQLDTAKVNIAGGIRKFRIEGTSLKINLALSEFAKHDGQTVVIPANMQGFQLMLGKDGFRGNSRMTPPPASGSRNN